MAWRGSQPQGLPAVGGEWVPFPPALSSLRVPESDWEHCSDGTLCAQELAGSARPPAAAQLARDVLRVWVCVCRPAWQ